MKKNIHLGLCCLLSGLMMSSSLPVQSNALEANEITQDGRTGRILSSVSEVVEGLVKLIKNPHEKANVLHNVGKMLAGIMNVAAGAVQKNAQLSSEEIDSMVALIQDMDLTIDQATQDTLMKHALVMHNYLRTMSAEELEAFLHRAEETQGAELNEDSAISDEQDHALQSGILGSLHQMIHELFAIIQNPENPQLISQNIADILGNIMNVASQAIKYEYMTSKNAEETVALYIDTFSNELTKKITHLMLQTALNIRSRSCCKTNCCKTSCCKSSCGNSSGCCSSNGCKPCCRTMPADDEVTRACGSCGKCNSSCSSGTCCKSETIDQEVTRKCCSKCNNSCSKCCNKGTTADDEALRACGKCSNSCGKCCKSETMDQEATRKCCGKCSSSCGKCCTATTTTNTLVRLADAADDEVTRACGSCGKCNSSCSSGTCCKSETIDQEVTRKNCCGKCNNSCSKCCNKGTTADDEALRACGKCSNSCGKCCKSETIDQEATRKCCGTCNNSCGKCCAATTTTNTGYVEPADNDVTRACCGSCSSSCGKCCNKGISTAVAATLMRCSTDCTCNPCECTPDQRSPRCGCSQTKPTVTTRDTATEETKIDEPARCGCSQTKPTVTTRENTTEETKIDEPARCGCNTQKPTVTTRENTTEETKIDEPARCGCKPQTTQPATVTQTRNI